MAISDEVKRQFFTTNGETNQVIRLPPAAIITPVGPNRRVGKPWTKEEHERFLEGLQMFPNGPWRRIATHVGTRTNRQTMTHAQKYRERISRLLVAPRDHNSIPTPVATPAAQHRETVQQQTLFDDLDLQILSCLLEDDDAMGNDTPPSTENMDLSLGDLLGEADGDDDMLRLLSELDVGEYPMPL